MLCRGHLDYNLTRLCVQASGDPTVNKVLALCSIQMKGKEIIVRDGG
jgi:hypothetical protein